PGYGRQQQAPPRAKEKYRAAAEDPGERQGLQVGARSPAGAEVRSLGHRAVERRQRQTAVERIGICAEAPYPLRPDLRYHRLPSIRGADMHRYILAAAFALVAQAATADEITLKAITAFAENTTYSKPFERFIQRVNESGKGLVHINYIGGPKAMPPFEVGNALKGGVVDIANSTGAFYTNVMPESDAWKLTERPMAELRRN